MVLMLIGTNGPGGGGGQEPETINFGGQEVKGQGQTRLT